MFKGEKWSLKREKDLIFSNFRCFINNRTGTEFATHGIKSQT